MAKDLLLEIGMEEVPSKFVRPATVQLADRIGKWLEESRIGFSAVKIYATPRRFALLIHGVEERQRDERVEAKGPSRKIALDEKGEWSKAALGFARSQGVETSELFFKELSGVEYVHATKNHIGVDTTSLLGDGLKHIITSLNFPKNMRWGSWDLRFVRPIRWIVALFGNDIVNLEIAGVVSGRATRGHRFLGQNIDIQTPSEYETALKEQYVIVDIDERKDLILKQVNALAAENGWNIPVKEDLLEEVLFLVEYPTALFGSFNPDFLQIPKEVLITSMREHQRYFPVLDKAGNLLPHFVTVRNGNKEHLAAVARGNEKVLRARLSDAKFFYSEDQKMTIDSALKRLDTIVFQEELGSIGDKVRRIEAISAALAARINADEETSSQIIRAAAICKFDLVSQMVYEFPELQGTMGEDYARKAGEPETVAKAVNEHYQPRFSGDSVPTSLVGATVSLADKIDTIAGCFSIGIIPTGSQDPYALRRQAAGIVQILLEYRLPIGLNDVLDIALGVLGAAKLLKREEAEIRTSIYDFFGLRLKNLLSERGVRYDIIDAVLGSGFDSIIGAVNRSEELARAMQDPSFKTATESFSRAANLAAKAESVDVSADKFTEQAEHDLYQAWHTAHVGFSAHLSNTEASAALLVLRHLEAPITAFFDAVMVMAEDPEVRANRLGLLSLIAMDVRRFADFSKLVW
ncbi:MAG: glycine--tRNA ligase subunit beta [Gorillibacterium sp.]|nr:glycine--tRNA ligase subunit beta [Gorillibacterium sp.]